MNQQFTLNVNGQTHSVDADPDMPLLYALRDNIGLNNPHFGCGLAQCGACTVHMERQPIRSCATPVSSVGDARIVTLSGLGTPEHPHRHCHVNFVGQPEGMNEYAAAITQLAARKSPAARY
jgi:nicotinate dehydrogenase subunit A